MQSTYPCIFNVQDTKTMTMTIVHLMQRNVNVCPYAGNIFTAKKVYIFTIKSTVFFFHVMRRIFILSFLILSADTDFVL